MSERKTIFNTILNILLILLAVLIIYWLIELIIRGSPTLDEFNFGLIILIAGLLIKMYREVGKTKVEIKYTSIGVKQGFDKIRKDMDLIKNKLKI